MKPLFTVHAGEYLVGEHIERTYPRWSVWVPSKDTGIDLLVTPAKNRKAVSLQVKFSKDFNPTHGSPLLQNRLLAAGWWTHDPQKSRTQMPTSGSLCFRPLWRNRQVSSFCPRRNFSGGSGPSTAPTLSESTPTCGSREPSGVGKLEDWPTQTKNLSLLTGSRTRTETSPYF